MKGFRYWLADLISGGELTRLDHKYWGLWEIAAHNREAENRRRYEALDRWTIREADLRHSLTRIAALETPHANATVRKMAKIARGEAWPQTNAAQPSRSNR